jgi:hypothetical protein
MNASTIDPLTLPSLPLGERSHLPKHPAVYFVLDGERILYIGQTVNLAQRWAPHHRWNELKALKSSVKIAWLECSEVKLLSEIETALINHFAPPMNGKVSGEVAVRIFMPESLRNHFKAVCAKQGRNMSEVVTEFVKEYVAQHENPSLKEKGKGAA